MRIENFFDNLRDLADNIGETIEYSNEIKEITKEGIQEVVYEISDNLGSAVRVLNNTGKNAGNIVQTIGNALHINDMDDGNGLFSEIYRAVKSNTNIDTELIEEITRNIREKNVREDTNYKLADHLFVYGVFGLYTHHGIYSGNGNVIHYHYDGVDNICVHEVTLDEFSQGNKIYIYTEKASPIKYTPEEAIRRAESRMYESEYNLIINNCENFVRWCRFGD